LNKFCKNDYLKSKIDELVLNVNKIIFEGYVLANLHIIRLLCTLSGYSIKVRRYLLSTKRFFKMFWHKCWSCYLYHKEMDCKDEELVATFEKHYKNLRPTGYQPGFRDYMNGIIGNGCAVDMETATKNHLTLNSYKRCSKYIQKLYPELSKGEVYDIMKGIYEEKYSGSNKIVFDFRKLLVDQVPTNWVIEKNPTNVLKVYKDVLQYYKEFEKKKHQDSTGQEMMMFPQRMQGKKTKIRLQRKGMRQYNKCLKYMMF
jgi:hypothetical protein